MNRSKLNKIKAGLRKTGLACLFGCLVTGSPLSAEQATDTSKFITLGTVGGPIPNPDRSQPANILLWQDHGILIDAGDGAPEQLAKANIALGQVQTVFISHLHFDHTGGLFALFGMRYQVRTPGVLTIYGPPGTKRMVDSLVAAMRPMSEFGAGNPGVTPPPPEPSFRVVEIVDGDKIVIDDVTVTVASNSHYSYPSGSPEALKFQSLSFRFDMPDRSIVYTGDTGPSKNVEQLAKGADLLVSEVIDVNAVLGDLRINRPDLKETVFEGFASHFVEHHLTAAEAAKLAQNAGVKKLVLTHLAIGSSSSIKDIENAVTSAFDGSISIASDLDEY
jgi:ribonuclease BN (tRNA processing enzyme)